MSNRGRHRKKKIIQKFTYGDLIKCINQMTNDDTFFNPISNTKHQFNPYFSINEQGTTSQIMPTSSH